MENEKITKTVPIEFAGEGNPVERLAFVADPEPLPGTYPVLTLSDPERQALQSVLHRENSCRPHHDGLRGLLSLSHAESEALLGLLRRI
jgi:hypothetical protein